MFGILSVVEFSSTLIIMLFLIAMLKSFNSFRGFMFLKLFGSKIVMRLPMNEFEWQILLSFYL